MWKYLPLEWKSCLQISMPIISDYGYLVLLGICLLLTGCLEQEEWENLELDDPTSHLHFPLLFETITTDALIGLVSDSTSIILNEEGVYAAVFEAASIEKTREDVFPKIPIGIPLPVSDSIFEIPLPALDQADPTSAILKGDHLRLILNSDENDEVSVKVWIPQILEDGAVFRREYVIPSNEQGMGSFTTPDIELSGYQVDFTQGFVQLKYDSRREDGTRIVLPTSQLFIDALDFHYVEGRIHQNSFPTGLEVIEVDVQDTIVGGSYKFTNPKIHFDFTNSFGFPIGVKVKEASIVNLDGDITPLISSLFDDLIDLEYPRIDQVGDFATRRITIDRRNSNLAEISQSDIASIRYDLDIIANPDADDDDEFFLTDTSFARMDAELELSFEALIDSISLRQDIELMVEELDSIGFLRLKLWVQNGIPLGFTPHLMLVSENPALAIPLEPEAEGLVSPAGSDDSGNVTNHRESVLFYTLGKDDLTRLSRMDYLQLVLTVTSPDDGQKMAVIRPDQTLSVGIGAEIKLE